MFKKLRTILVLLPLAKQAWDWYTSRKNRKNASKSDNSVENDYWY